MEILEAYKVVPPTGNTAKIFEFRGRRYQAVEIADETGATVKTIKRSKVRSVHVAAENLFDAVVHLRTFRPEFVPNQAFCLGMMRIEVQR